MLFFFVDFCVCGICDFGYQKTEKVANGKKTMNRIV